jgi:hypothetical protein
MPKVAPTTAAVTTLLRRNHSADFGV